MHGRSAPGDATCWRRRGGDSPAGIQLTRRSNRWEPGGKPFEPRPPALLVPDEQGNTDVNALNAALDAVYLKDPRNPRWVAKPTVAYLWARTVRCKGCRATVPLLKTCWLAKKDAKRVLLTLSANAASTGVVFGIEADVPLGEGNTARRREQDKRTGAGTMSRSGARCPLCPATMTMEDLRLDGRAGRVGTAMTAVVVDGTQGKEYRLPTELELRAARVDQSDLDTLYAEIPFGLPDEPTPKAGIGASRAFSVDGYGFDKWRVLFTNRQLLAVGTFVQEIRSLPKQMSASPAPWGEAIAVYSACVVSKFADYSSAICSWHNSGEKLRNTFARFALPMVWDYCEVNPLSDTTGGFAASVNWLARVCEHLLVAVHDAPAPAVLRHSAAQPQITANEHETFDLICTDPPYYDAIPYSDLMDFFHVWLRRALWGLSHEIDGAFEAPLGPKWNAAAGDGELIDDAARFGGDREASKRNYEDGMARAFSRFQAALRSDGRLVIVFANKSPDAWETLVFSADPRRVRGGRPHGRFGRKWKAGSGRSRPRHSPPRSGSFAGNVPGREWGGIRRCLPRCERTSRGNSGTSGSRASVARTSCGRRLGRRWRRSRTIKS